MIHLDRSSVQLILPFIQLDQGSVQVIPSQIQMDGRFVQLILSSVQVDGGFVHIIPSSVQLDFRRIQMDGLSVQIIPSSGHLIPLVFPSGARWGTLEDTMPEKKDVPYHSDIDGLVHGWLLCAGKPTQSVTTAQALEWLALPAAEQGEAFLWLHFSLSNSGTIPWLAHLDLPEAILRGVQGDESSSRLEVSGGLVLAVVKDVVYDFSLRISEISTLFGVLSSKFLITLRSKQLRTVERLRQAVRSGEEFRSSTELLARLLLHQADVLESIQRETNVKVDAMEDSLLADRRLSASSELATLRRVLVRLQRLLSPEPAALYRLVNRPVEWMTPADLTDLREAVEEFSVVIGDIRQLNERIKLLQEELAVRAAERTNRTLFTLTLVTVLAIPFNVIGAMFGMNVGGIPFNQDPLGFWEVVGIVGAVTVAAFFIFRRPR